MTPRERGDRREASSAPALDVPNALTRCSDQVDGPIRELPPQHVPLELMNLHLGIVTYSIAADWDIETIIANCTETGFEGVELRTTHAHGVEPTLSSQERADVQARFEDSPVRLVSLGSVCEYHSADPAEVERNIEETKRFCELAHDVGALGVKVRPNGFPDDPSISKEQTLQQIGEALNKCGPAAADAGVEVWVEVHGPRTSLLSNIESIMQHCPHPAVGVNWNSNQTDLEEGGLEVNFRRMGDRIKSMHICELWNPDYPYRDLFRLLREAGYDRYTLAEIPGNEDPIRLMRYYRALWLQLQK